jgi:hypothetical protein
MKKCFLPSSNERRPDWYGCPDVPGPRTEAERLILEKWVSWLIPLPGNRNVRLQPIYDSCFRMRAIVIIFKVGIGGRDCFQGEQIRHEPDKKSSKISFK